MAGYDITSDGTYDDQGNAVPMGAFAALPAGQMPPGAMMAGGPKIPALPTPRPVVADDVPLPQSKSEAGGLPGIDPGIAKMIEAVGGGANAEMIGRLYSAGPRMSAKICEPDLACVFDPSTAAL